MLGRECFHQTPVSQCSWNKFCVRPAPPAAPLQNSHAHFRVYELHLSLVSFNLVFNESINNLAFRKPAKVASSDAGCAKRTVSACRVF